MLEAPFRYALALSTILLAAGCLSATDTPAGDPLSLCVGPCERPIDTSAAWAFEPHVVWDPSDPDHIVAASMDFSAITMRIHLSFDGGATFETKRFPGEVGPEHPLAAYSVWADPNLAMLDDGTVLFTGMAGQGATYVGGGDVHAFSNFDIFLARSTDGGRTWPDVTLLEDSHGVMGSGPPVGTYGDQPQIDVGPDGTALVAWSRSFYDVPNEAMRGDLVTSVSRDGGITWSAPVVAHVGGYDHRPRPLVLDESRMYVTFHDLQGERMNSPTYLAVSKDGGASWETRPLQGIPSGKGLYLDAVGETLYLASNPVHDDGGQSVLLWRSDDGGMTWEPETIDTPEAPGEVTPVLKAAEDGTLVLSYLHARPDGGNDIIATLVHPDGARRDIRHNVSAIGANDPHGVLDWPAFGDYRGVATRGKEAIVVWASGDAPDPDLQLTRLAWP